MEHQVNNKKIFSRKRGAVLIMSVLFFFIVSLGVVLGVVSPIVRYLAIAQDYMKSKQSYFGAEAASEDAFYRVKNNISISFPLSMTIDNVITTTTLDVTGSNEKTILSEGNFSSAIRRVSKDLNTADGFSFNYGVQIGLGGLRMKNNSTVIGNAYSDGPILGDDNSKNVIFGTVVSASTTGSIDSIRATSTAYAHTIKNSTINGDAYYVTNTNNTIDGVLHPNSPDQPYATMPISDTLLDTWETNAATGGTISCPSGKTVYTISSSVSLGPTKINCDVEIKNNNTVVTLTGNIWISGNFTVSNDPQIRVANSVGNKNVAIIVDKISNRSTGSLVVLSNAPTFWGSVDGQGVVNPDSYVMLISRNSDSETKGGVNNEIAIHVKNSATGNILVYAPHGEIILENHATLREVTSYKLTLKNDTQVIYQLGLAQPLFTAGPGGQWKVKRWKERK